MATITQIKAPYEISWSRNPILFSFKINPFTANDITNRTRMLFALMVETEFMSNNFESVWSAVEYPDANGFVTIDLSAVLDTQLEFYVPNKQYVKFHRCKKQIKRYYLRYSMQDNDALMIVPADTIKYNVAKGGLSKEQWHRDQFFSSNILADHAPLHNLERFEHQTLRVDEPKWLYFMMPDYISTFLKLVITPQNELGALAAYDMLEQNMSGVKWEIFCVPVDYATLDLASNIAPGNICTFYTVAVWDDTNQMVDIASYRMDHRPMYEAQYLLYRNSLGGLDTQSFLGEKDFDIEVQKSKAEIVQLSDYLNAFNMQRESFTIKSFRSQKSKANTGWINKNTTDRLIDMFLDKQVYSPLGNKLIPVQIDSKTATLYKDVTKLYNLTLEWALAWMDENFTLQNTVDQGDTCPAVFYFLATQKYGGKLHLVWKLEADWDKIEIEYIVDGVTNTITLAGNSGETDIYIDDPATGANHSLKVKARTICNDEATPFSYGPYTSQTIFTLLIRMTPIAVDDVADETFRGAGSRKLQRLGTNMEVLLNDIPLNGGWGTFENFYDLVPAITAVSQNGATVIYNLGDDTIDYIPTGGSLAITDEDFVHYKFNENIAGFGPVISNIAKIRIPMKGQIPKVYVHIAYLNVQQSFEKYGFLNQYEQQDVFIDIYLQFFQDAAMTIPIDVTAFGLVIAYETWQDTTPWDYTGGPTLFPEISLGITTVGATGFSMPLLLNFHRINFTDLGLAGGVSVLQSHKLVPASGTGIWEEVM